MNRSTRARNPFRMAYFALLILLTGALALVLMLNTQQATASNLAAQTALGTTFTYQGKLNDGNNPANGTYDFQFSLFDAATGSAPIGAPVTLNGVNVQQGVFTVQLDFGANAFTGAPRWLGISVRPANTGDFAPLNPRQAISPAPYAIYADSAGNATTATNATNANSVPWTGITGVPDGFKDGVDDTGAGHNHFGETWAAPGNGLTISSDSTSGANYGIAGYTHSADGYGLYGYNLATNGNFARGIYGQADSPGGRGVQGDALKNTGENYGVAGFTNSGAGVGVLGRNQSKQTPPSDYYAVGVLGMTDAPDGNGIEGNANATSGKSYGVAGYSISPDGLGVYGGNSSAGGRGVRGNATATTGGSFGVEGYSQSPQGLGVFGYNSAIGGTGIEGDAVATSGKSYGVLGYSQSPQGVGVYGFNATKGNGGLAGYFDGPVTITGKLTNAAASFKVDHPLDPANKYLSHAAVESPDMMNIYNGNVLLDAKGEAWVQMPPWFEALNLEFRYQLTAIGAPGPNLYIAQEVTNNQFKIAGGVANMKVSWQVTGIRHDPYAQAHRIPVEEDKPLGERGTYLAPAEYGQPETNGLNFRAARVAVPDVLGKDASTKTGAQQAQPTENK